MTLQAKPFTFDLSDLSEVEATPQADAPEGRQMRGGGHEAPVLGAFLTQALDLPTGRAQASGDMPSATESAAVLPGAALPGGTTPAVAEAQMAPATPAEAKVGAGGSATPPAALAAAVIVGASGAVSGDYTPTDPLYADQWHFPLLGDIETIWDEYTGAGVTVYVADEGVEYTHEDLAANYDASMHFVYDGVTYDPDPRFNAGHGTSCAGLIAAEQGNGLGGTGVAYDATITGVDFLNDTQFLDVEIAMASLQWAENFDIMSNSWGITPTYAPYQSPFDTRPDNVQDDTVAVFELISSTGRDGLGTIVMQAAGNDTLNAQGDAVNGTRFTALMAATDEFGFATYYTNYGSNILVTAPAAAVTTDLTGFQGYDRGNYTTDFGGTSAATPVAAGVVALMLEANPNLGWRDIHNILAISASHTGSAYDATEAATYEQGLWFANDATNWNGGGMMFNLTYGYGTVDAYAAVRMAEIWLELGDEAQVSGNEQHVSASTTLPTAIADTGISVVAINVPDEVAIENIQVTVDITHADATDLKIWLVSPDGTRFMLFENEGNATLMDTGFQWIFGVEAARGMTSAGLWTLQIFDRGAGSEGTVDAVTLDFYGSDLSDSQVHHITDDFLALVQIDPARGDFHDEGGHDILNMVAVSGDISADLAYGGSISVDGTQWISISNEGDRYEDIFTGDGNDSVWGNGADNDISGMRGDDAMYGQAGADTIDGGTGDDYVEGGGAEDSIIGGDGADTLIGDSQSDYLDGGTGDDLVNAGQGADTVMGDDGADELKGKSGHDWIEGGSGNDTIAGDDGRDTLMGGDGDDSLTGVRGYDILDGGNGDDSLKGGAGYDEVYGGNGNDTLGGGVSDDTMDGGAGDDVLSGNQGSDLMSGGERNDLVRGNGGHDALYGNDGQDTLEGGAGNDTLDGGAGDDLLDGGGDEDVIIFSGGDDTVLGFVQGEDLIDLSSVAAIVDFVDLAANHLSDGVSGAIISAGTDSLTFDGLFSVDLTADDFLF